MYKLIQATLIAISLSLFAPLFVQPAYAACPKNPTDSQQQALNGLGATGSNCSDQGVTDLVSSIVNILSIVVGIASIIVIIISGLKFITSAGDSGKVSSAKNTLIYALIGVAVAALAQFFVHFVLDQVTRH